MKHAKVDFFKEVDPQIMIFDNGNFAIVTFIIEMSFKYDDRIESDWNGADMMTLVRENGRWIITSDMYACDVKQTD